MSRLQEKVVALAALAPVVAAQIKSLDATIARLRDQNTGALSQAEQDSLADQIEGAFQTINGALGQADSQPQADEQATTSPTETVGGETPSNETPAAEEPPTDATTTSPAESPFAEATAPTETAPAEEAVPSQEVDVAVGAVENGAVEPASDTSVDVSSVSNESASGNQSPA